VIRNPPALTADDLRDALPPALAVRRWADDLLAGAPYPSLDALVEAATTAATPLTEAEVDEALAAHPRIGERPTAAHGEAEARFSRAEQASSDADDAELAARLAAGNRAYEERFGRVFLIRAAGRTRAEILAELERRLRLDDDAELATVAAQLREIMALRLRATFADDDASAAPADEPPAPSLVTTHVLDTASGRPAPGVPVRLEVLSGDGPSEVGSGVTDDDGRVRTLGPATLAPGPYRLTFDTAEYLAESADESTGTGAFFPEVAVTFVVGLDDAHLHVPLLLSPFGYSTYRGS
jgi:hydroxyisourate hydrolase